MRTHLYGLLGLLILVLVKPPALLAGELRVGDVVGSVLSTDIRAYLNGFPIPSMNVGGRTVIVAEDLRHYGFDVAWNPGRRTLVIRENPGKRIDPLPAGEAQDLAVGTPIKDVLHTDIKTYLGEKEITSFNIDGYTAIPLQELAPWGRLDWYPETRTVSFTSNTRPGQNSAQEPQKTYSFNINQADQIDFRVDFVGDQMFLGGENAGFGLDGKPMLSLTQFAARLGYRLEVDPREKTFTVKHGVYAFTLGPASQETQLYYDGRLLEAVGLECEPLLRGGDLYVYSLDLKRLFGLTMVWNDSERTLDVSYPVYDLEELGLPATVRGDKLTVRGHLIEKGYHDQYPRIELVNKTAAGVPTGSSMGLVGRGQDGRPLYNLESTLENLRVGHNQVEVTVRVGERLLYKGLVEVTPSLEDMELEVNVAGPSSGKVVFSSPLRGYTKVNSDQFPVAGSVETAGDDELALEIEKWEEGEFRPVVQEKAPILDNGFAHNLRLSAGEGLYKVTVFRLMAGAPRPSFTPPGPARVKITWFYLDYEKEA